MKFSRRRLLKAFFVFAALLLLLGVGLVVALNWYFSSEGFKRNLVDAFRQATGYEIRLEGDLGVSLYPWLGFSAETVRLYEPGRSDPLVEAAEVSAGVRIVPLLSGHLELDVVALDQVVVTVLRRADGSTGWDALARVLFPSGEETRVQGPKFQSMSVRGVQIREGSLVYVDEVHDQRWEVNGLDLRTGVYEPGSPVALSLGADISRPEEELSGRLTVTGELGVDLGTGDVRLDQGRVDVELAWPGLLRSSSPAQISATVSLDTAEAVLTLESLHAKGAGLSLSGRAEVRELFSSPLVTGHLETQDFSPRALINTFAPDFIPESDQGIFRQARLALDLAYDGEILGVTQLDLAMDDSRLTGGMELGVDGRPQAFDLALDQLDFDRYYRLFITPEDFILADFFPEFIRTWSTSGTLTAGAMIAAGLEAEDLSLRLDCGGGEFLFRVEQARVNGGAFQGRYQAHVAAQGADYLVSMQGEAALLDAQARSLPLGEGDGYALTGAGDLKVTYAMAEQPYALDRIIDDVLRHMRLSADLVLHDGGFQTMAEPGTAAPEQLLAGTEIHLHLTLDGDGAGGGHDPFGYQAGLALRMDGSTPWSLNGKLSGPLTLSFALDDFQLAGAEAGLQYRGPELPETDPLALVSAVLDLDSSGTGRLSEFEAAAFGLRLAGDLQVVELFTDQYALDGKIDLSCPRPEAVVAVLYGDGDEDAKREDPEVFQVISGQADVRVAQDVIELSELGLRLDDTHLTGLARLEELGAGRTTFQLTGDGINLDRYRPARPEASERPDPCDKTLQPEARPLPLESLRALNLEGSLALDHLVRNGFNMERVRLDLAARGGDISLSQMHADFYGGSLDGGLDIFVGSEALDASLDLEARDFQAGPMLQDQADRDYVRGLSEVTLHLKTAGATNKDLFEQLSGSAGFVVRDGSYRFLGGDEEETEEPQNGIQSGALEKKPTPRTFFDLAQADFKVDKGVFEVTDFKVSSTMLSGTGGGWFDVARGEIDLDLNADFVAAPDVPILITGCLYDPEVSVPGDEILQNAVRDIITIPLRPLQYLRDQLF